MGSRIWHDYTKKEGKIGKGAKENGTQSARDSHIYGSPEGPLTIFVFLFVVFYFLIFWFFILPILVFVLNFFFSVF